MPFDVNAAASRWSSGLAGATDKITAGVNGVAIAPGQAAAKRDTAYVQGVTNNVAKWKKNVAAVTKESWQADMINKGIPRIATGATNAEPKMVNFFTQLSPYIDNLKAQLPARGDLNTNVQRMVSFVQGMAKFSYNK